MKVAQISTRDYTPKKSILNISKRYCSYSSHDIFDISFKGKEAPKEKIDTIVSDADKISTESLECIDKLPIFKNMAEKYIDDADKFYQTIKGAVPRYGYIHCLDCHFARVERDKDNPSEMRIIRSDGLNSEQVLHLNVKDDSYKIHAVDVKQEDGKYIRAAKDENSTIIVHYEKSSDTFCIPKLTHGAKFMKDGTSIWFSNPEIALHNNSITKADEIYITDKTGKLTSAINGFEVTRASIPTEYNADGIYVYDNKGLKKAYKGVKGKISEISANEAYSRNIFGKIVQDKIQTKDIAFLRDISSYAVDELLSRLQ